MGKMHIYDDLIQNYLPLPQPFDELFTIIADQIGLSYGFSCCNLGSAKFQLEGEKTLNAGSEGGCTHLDLVGIISLRPSIDDPYA